MFKHTKYTKIKPKVMLLHNIAWSHYKAKVFNELYKLLKSKGSDFFVVHIAVTEHNRQYLGNIDLSIHEYPYKILFNTALAEISFLHKSRKIIREIFAFKPDLIILPGYADPSYWSILLFAKLIRCKVIITIDSTKIDRQRTAFKEMFKTFFVRRCNGAFSYGTKSSEYAIDLGIAPARVFIRCQTTDSKTIGSIYDELKSQKEQLILQKNLKPHNIIFVGRLDVEKNVKLLIRVFYELKKSHIANDWGLILVGDGKEKDSLKNLTRTLSVADVNFVGSHSWKDVIIYYVLADVLVLPSMSETWGLVVNEAMICNLPVVVSNRCGAAYDLVKEGQNGYVFDPHSFKELFDILMKFVAGEVNIVDMGNKSKEIIEQYTPEKSAIQMANGIRKVLSEK